MSSYHVLLSGQPLLRKPIALHITLHDAHRDLIRAQAISLTTPFVLGYSVLVGVGARPNNKHHQQHQFTHICTF